MQLFGVGALELLLIMIVAVLVVGPERLPEVAAEIGRWVRRMRAYARYVAGDFQEVMKELEEEVGASREEFQEIARDLSGEAKAVESDLAAAASDVEGAAVQAEAAAHQPARPVAATNGASNGGAITDVPAAAASNPASRAAAPQGESVDAETPPDGDDAEEAEPGDEVAAPDAPWFQPAPSRARSRRRRE